MNNKKKGVYRPIRIQIPKEDATWLKQECERYGISVSTAFRAYILKARLEGLPVPIRSSISLPKDGASSSS